MSKWKTTLATVTNQLILGSINLWTDQKSCIWRTEFCDFKMNVIKWQLNFLLRNFGLKSYLWFLSKSHYALVRFRNYSYDEIRRSSQLRTLLKRVVVSRTWKKFQARTGFEPMTSAIPVQRSTNWANKPTGSWSMNWVQINIRVNEDFRYMKIHIFALRCTYVMCLEKVNLVAPPAHV